MICIVSGYLCKGFKNRIHFENILSLKQTIDSFKARSNVSQRTILYNESWGNASFKNALSQIENWWYLRTIFGAYRSWKYLHEWIGTAYIAWYSVDFTILSDIWAPKELKVMEMYWNEDPNERPESFSQIKKILIQIHESRRSKKNESIIDTFLS